MDIFFSLFINLLPLYGLIGLGFVASRFLDIDQKSLANLGIFICLPVVIFGFVAELNLKPSYALLPLVAFSIHAVISISALKLGQKIYGDNRANLLALCASMGNAGYFGLPLILLLFDEQLTGVYMFMLLGVIVHETIIAYYIAARGKFDIRASLVKLVKFPATYAVSAGLAFNFSGLELPDLFQTYWIHFKGAYVIIGMMVIGAALANVKRFKFSVRFVGLAFLGKFIAWPVLTFLLIQLDRNFTHLFNVEIYRLLMVLSLVPQAANATAFATQFGLKPEKAAVTVLTGTIFALFYIPAVLALLGIY